MIADLATSVIDSPLLRASGIRSALGVPLMTKQNALGVLYVGKRSVYAFADSNVHLLQFVANRVSHAIDHARLYTDLQEREHRLDEAYALLNTIFATAPVGIAFWDTDLKYVRLNDALAAMHGLPVAAQLGRTIPELLPELDSTVAGLLRQVLMTGAPVIDQEISGRTPVAPGQARHWLASYYAVRNRAGTIIGVGGIVVEITARKRLEAQLLQTQKMESIGQLAGGIAHDFNNILTAIAGYTDLLLAHANKGGRLIAEGGTDESAAFHPSSFIPDLLEVQKAAQSASVLTCQLLTFARKQTLSPQVLDLNTLIAGMEGLLGRLIGEDITLNTRPAVQLRPVKADPVQIEQVIINLAVNARDAMPLGGTLTIETTNVVLDERYAASHPGVKAGAYVMLAVSDTGVGMDAEVHAHAFEPFFTTKEPGEGTGLGPATCYGIVKQHGGAIWIYSEVDHGTTVKVYLPPASEPVMASARPPVVAALPTGTEAILLAEDDSAVRTFAARVLRAQGYTVLEAMDGQEAVRLASAYISARIDLLLTDVVMPKLGGADLTQEIRRLYPQIALLYTSGYPTGVLTQHGAFMPKMAFIQKPFSPRTLALKVREVLDERRDDRQRSVAER